MTLLYSNAILRRFPASYVTLYEPRGIHIDLQLAEWQHDAYAAALREAGLAVAVAPADMDQPDCVFVEDTAVLWGDKALIARPSEWRLGEEAEMISFIGKTHEVRELPKGALLEGGDVMSTESTTFVGLSSRTNAAGAQALADFMREFDRDTVQVPVDRCLHLKTGVTYLGEGTMAIAPNLVDPSYFRDYALIEIPEDESPAANSIRTPRHLIIPKGYPRSAEKLSAFAATNDIGVMTVDLSEFEKGDGSSTCLSLLWG